MPTVRSVTLFSVMSRLPNTLPAPAFTLSIVDMVTAVITSLISSTSHVKSAALVCPVMVKMSPAAYPVPSSPAAAPTATLEHTSRSWFAAMETVASVAMVTEPALYPLPERMNVSTSATDAVPASAPDSAYVSRIWFAPNPALSPPTPTMPAMVVLLATCPWLTFMPTVRSVRLFSVMSRAPVLCPATDAIVLVSVERAAPVISSLTVRILSNASVFATATMSLAA